MRRLTALASLATLTALTALAITGCEEDRTPVNSSPIAVAERALARDTPNRVCEKSGGLYNITNGTCSTGDGMYQKALCRQLDILGYTGQYQFNSSTKVCEKQG
jgi:hypothetical protein